MRRAFEKYGAKFVGVVAQYSGTAGKITNCQIGVFLAYANRHGPVLIDRELYVPREWADDPSRGQEAGVPAGTASIPKSTLAKGMLERAFAHGIQAAWVTGDTIYGGDYQLRSWLEERDQPYVLAIPKNQRIGLTHRADEVVGSWPADQWQRLSAGEGSQGPRLYDWGWQSLDFRLTEPGWKQWLLARRSLSDPTELAYSFVFAPESVSFEAVVRAAGSRWQVEEGFELAKQQVGLDEYEVRHWQGWYRHVTLAMFALAFLTVVKTTARKKGRSAAKPSTTSSR